jgi:hypothetical protein
MWKLALAALAALLGFTAGVITVFVAAEWYEME